MLLTGLGQALSSGAQGYYGGVIAGEKERQRRLERGQEFEIRREAAGSRGRQTDPYASEKQLARQLAAVAYSMLSNPDRQSALLANPQLHGQLVKSVEHLTRVASGAERLDLKLAQPLAELERSMGDASLGGGQQPGLPPEAQQELKLGGEPTAAYAPTAEGKGMSPDTPFPSPFPLPFGSVGLAPGEPSPDYAPTGGFGPAPGAPTFKGARAFPTGKGAMPGAPPALPMGPAEPVDPVEAARLRYEHLIESGPDYGPPIPGETPQQAQRRRKEIRAEYDREVRAAERGMVLPSQAKIARGNAETQEDYRRSQIAANNQKVPESQARIEKGKQQIKQADKAQAFKERQAKEEGKRKDRSLAQRDRQLDIAAGQLALGNKREHRLGLQIKGLASDGSLTDVEKVRIRYLLQKHTAKPPTMFGFGQPSEAAKPGLDNETITAIEDILTKAMQRSTGRMKQSEEPAERPGGSKKKGEVPVLGSVNGAMPGLTPQEMGSLKRHYQAGDLNDFLTAMKKANPYLHRRSQSAMQGREWKAFVKKNQRR